MALMNIEESLDFAAADRFLLVRFFFFFFLTAYLEAPFQQARPHVNFLDDDRVRQGQVCT